MCWMCDPVPRTGTLWDMARRGPAPRCATERSCRGGAPPLAEGARDFADVSHALLATRIAGVLFGEDGAPPPPTGIATCRDLGTENSADLAETMYAATTTGVLPSLSLQETALSLLSSLALESEDTLLISVCSDLSPSTKRGRALFGIPCPKMCFLLCLFVLCHFWGGTSCAILPFFVAGGPQGERLPLGPDGRC